MSKPYVIGFMGHAGVGKTTVSKILHSLNTTDTEIASFATPLKKAIKDLCLFTDKQVYGSKEDKEEIDPRWGFSFRTAAQVIGTDCLRNMLDPQFHVKRMSMYLEQCKSRIVIVDDIRFADEAELVNGYGKCFQIKRPGFPAEDIRHSSEYPPTHLASGYYILNNFDTEDNLRNFLLSNNSFLKLLVEENLK